MFGSVDNMVHLQSRMNGQRMLRCIVSRRNKCGHFPNERDLPFASFGE